MQVWVRGDLVGGGGAPVASSVATVNPAIRLQAGQVLGSPSELSGPTSIVQNSEGLIYVADTQNHRIRVYESDGTLVDTIGSHGSGEGEFYEPRGMAVDDDDNLYVADTWNARVVKLDAEGEWITSWGTGTEDMGDGRVATMTGADEEGNQANPLGFFGPRSLAIDDEGRIYIADTGNRRIVVTDDTGEFLYQWGQAGSAPGSFNEPTTVEISESGILYVADSWNGRVQVFQQGEDGRYGPTPVHSWPVNGWQADTYLDPSLTTGPDGLVYVSVPSQQHVLAADPQGTVNLVWSGAGEDRVGLQVPSGLLVDDEGRVYVVDRDASRVLRFTLPDLLPAE
jgi:sugar lactone lactonase YvrE